MSKIITIKDCTGITAATISWSVACTAETIVWLAYNEYGRHMLLVAGTFEEAYYEYLDALPAEGSSDSDRREAYNLTEDEPWPDEPELGEGYAYQPNAGGGSGIVWVGYHWNLRTATKADAIAVGLKIRRDDD